MIAVAAVGGHPRVGTDSKRYALASQEVLGGYGLRVPIFGMDDTPDARGTVPLTVQPPLYPIALAALGGVRPGRIWPVAALNILFCGVIAGCTYCIGRRVGGTAIGVASGLLTGLSPAVIAWTLPMMSEPMFIAMCVSSLCLLMESRASHHRGWLLAASGAAAACAIATRFAGIAIVPLFAWEALREFRRAGWRGAAKVWGLTAMLPLAATAALWAWNYVCTGHIRGYEPPDPLRSYAGAIAATAEMIGRSLGLTRLKADGGWFWLTCLAMIPALPAGALVARRQGWWAYFWRGGDLLLGFALVYAAVVVGAMKSYQQVLEWRFVAPLSPVLIVMAVMVIVRGWAALARPRAAAVAGAISVALLGLFLVYETTNLVMESRQFHEPYGPQVRACFGWLEGHTSRSEAVATNSAFEVPWFCGNPAMSLRSHADPSKGDAVVKDMPAEVARRMSEIGIRYLVLLPKSPEVIDDNERRFVAALRANGGGGRFELVFGDDSGMIYTLAAKH